MVAYAPTHTAGSACLAHAARPGSAPGPRQSGVSLVEVMVALALGLFLIAGIIQVLSSSQTSYRLTEATARAQENGRYALHVLSEQFRQSRSMACRDIYQEAANEALKNTVKSCILLADPKNCIGDPRIGTTTPLGYTVSAPAQNSLSGLPGTVAVAVGQHWLRGDVLVSWGTSGEGLYTVKPKPGDLATREIELLDLNTSVAIADADFRGGHLAMITDCGSSDIFTISNPTADDPLSDLAHAATRYDPVIKEEVTINKSVSLSTLTYSAGGPRARVFPFDLVVAFICCVDQHIGDTQSGDAVKNCARASEQFRPALCRWSASSGSVDALVLDVADMSVRYHIKASTDAAGSAASAVSNWSLITSAEVKLLVTGGEEVKPSPASPQVGDLGVKMDSDRHLYQVFDTTIAIRSRDPSQ